MNASRRIVLSLTLLTFAGCSKENARVEPPAYSSDAGAAALAEYDKNKDGVLSGGELDRVPALKASLAQVDKNGDKKISAEEIDARVAQWREHRIGEMPVRCVVSLDGVPLADAEVVFDPEPFLGPDMKPARGVSQTNGNAGITKAPEHLADPKYAGVACGWYKIRVTCPGKSIPAAYNTQTILGCEVAMDANWVSESEIVIELKSK